MVERNKHEKIRYPSINNTKNLSFSYYNVKHRSEMLKEIVLMFQDSDDYVEKHSNRVYF